jgi:hypothetical protein
MNPLPRTLLSLALLQAIGLESALADADMDRYASSSYAYCDAVMLAKVWNQSAEEAKATIGRKLGWGNERIIQANLVDARRRGGRCEFQDTEFDFDDAEALAALWHTSVAEAKTALAEKVSLGALDTARDVVRSAHASRASVTSAPSSNLRDSRNAGRASDDRNGQGARNSGGVKFQSRRQVDEERDMERNMQRYANSKYEYCDALMLSAFWGESVGEAKATIGHKLAINFAEDIEDSLRTARDRGQRCEFQDTGFEFDDAQALASMWRISVGEAKSQIAEKVSMGFRSDAQQAIERAHRRDQRGSRHRS